MKHFDRRFRCNARSSGEIQATCTNQSDAWAARGSHVRSCCCSGSPRSRTTSYCTDNKLLVALVDVCSGSCRCRAAFAACAVSVRTICCEDRCARAQRSRHANPSPSGSHSLEAIVHSPCAQRLCERGTARGAPASFPFPTPRDALGLGRHGTVGPSNFFDDDVSCLMPPVVAQRGAHDAAARANALSGPTGLERWETSSGRCITHRIDTIR